MPKGIGRPFNRDLRRASEFADRIQDPERRKAVKEEIVKESDKARGFREWRRNNDLKESSALAEEQAKKHLERAGKAEEMVNYLYERRPKPKWFKKYFGRAKGGPVGGCSGKGGLGRQRKR